MRQRNKLLVGKGSNKRGKDGTTYKGFRRIITAFDEDTFEEIRALAVRHNSSFAEQARILVEWGLEEWRNSDVR